MRPSIKLSIAFTFCLFIFVDQGIGQNIDSLQKNKADTLKIGTKLSVNNSSTNDPQPTGGTKGYMNHLLNNIRFPQAAVDARASGTVYVSIIVNSDGTMTDVKIEKDNVGFGLGEEAVRVIKLMPPWKPALRDGKPIRARYIVPVKYTLR